LASAALRATIGLVPQDLQLQPAVEAELSQLTNEDLLNFLIIAGISLFGIWVMTATGSSGEDEFEDAPPDECALCGDEINDWEGATYPGPKSRAYLGIQPGQAVCKRCVKQLT
jgi:hypothetical protein